MDAQTQLRKIVEEMNNVKNKPVCIDNAIMLGESLVYSFGLDEKEPDRAPDTARGLQNSRLFLEKVCNIFDDPTNIISVAPFAYAYLGKKVFDDALGIILSRARKKPAERMFLDELLTGAALLKPGLRPAFLEAAKKSANLEDGPFGISSLIHSIDPNATFTTADEFPAEFHTSDVNRVMNLLGAYIGLSLFKPGIGFSAGFDNTQFLMKGFDFLLEKPSPDHLLLIEDPNKMLNQYLMIDMVTELTPSGNQRPYNNGKYPGLVLSSASGDPKEIRKVYKESTVMFYAYNEKEMAELVKSLGGAKVQAKDLVIDLSGKSINQMVSTVIAHLIYARKKRQQTGLTDFSSMLEHDLADARQCLKDNNEFFFEIKNTFEGMGRGKAIDDLVQSGKFKQPTRTDYNLVVLLAERKHDLADLFGYGLGKKAEEFTEIPKIKETGLPFIIVTNKPLDSGKIKEAYGSPTIIYLAKNKSQEAEMRKANKGKQIFIVNSEELLRAGIYGTNIGHYFSQTYFESISKLRSQGITDMVAIGSRISEEIKSQRDTILFSPNLKNFNDEATKFYRLQRRFQATPLMMQLTDEVLMDACPTGGCFQMDEPVRGGCCGGGNLPGVLIDFAINYRQKVGEKKFFDELKRYQAGNNEDGNKENPWYFGTAKYNQRFKPANPRTEAAGPKKRETGRMTF